MKTSDSWSDHAPYMPHLNIVKQREIEINMKDEVLATVAWVAMVASLYVLIVVIT